MAIFSADEYFLCIGYIVRTLTLRSDFDVQYPPSPAGTHRY